MKEFIAFKKVNSYTYEVGYVKNNVFDHIVTKYNYDDTLQLCGLMKIANPHLEIKELKKFVNGN